MKIPRMLVYTVLSACASIALLAVVAGTAFAAPAHAKVLSATPGIGSTITQAPTTVTVVCAENINPNPKLSNLYVYAPSGDLISQGDAKVSLNNPLQMSITMKPSGDGVYVVQWKTVSAADGDPLTMHESEEYFLQALRAGAAGYLVKKAAPSDLHAAIRAIAHGGAFLYPGLAKALIRAYVTPLEEASTQGNSTALKDGAPLNKVSHELAVLTRREMEVLTQVAEGHTNQEIADALTISIKTVQAHRASVMEKLGLRDITQLVRFALRHGLIREELL